MVINDPAVLEEVEAAFAAYETALVTNDVETLDTLFWGSDHTIRYGPAESLYGRDEILANTEVTRAGAGKIGRQSQTWVKMPEGWRVVAAHVSLRDRTEHDAP